MCSKQRVGSARAFVQFNQNFHMDKTDWSNYADSILSLEHTSDGAVTHVTAQIPYNTKFSLPDVQNMTQK